MIWCTGGSALAVTPKQMCPIFIAALIPLVKGKEKGEKKYEVWVLGFFFQDRCVEADVSRKANSCVADRQLPAARAQQALQGSGKWFCVPTTR